MSVIKTKGSPCVRLAIACIMLAIVSVCASAQDTVRVQFSGSVIDSSNHQVVIGATVAISALKRGAIVESSGTFHIDNLPAGTYMVVVEAIGYATQRFTLTLSSNLQRTIVLSQQAVQGHEVVVIGRIGRGGLTSSSQSVTDIAPAELEKSRGATLGESLKHVAGVTLLQTGPSIAKPVIRGLHSQRVLVVNAGVPQEGQQWGAEHAPEIDPFAPVRIEVLRGSAGVEYGSGAIGGVIRLIPRPLPTEAGFDAQMNLNAFSNTMQGSGALMVEGGTSLLPRVGLRLQGSIRKAGDATTPDYVLGNTGFEELNGGMTLGYHDARFGSELYLSHFGTTLGIFRGSHINSAADLLQAIAAGRPQAEYKFGYTITPPKQVIAHNQISLNAHYQMLSLGRFEMQYGYQQNHRQEFDAHNARFVNDTGAILRQRPSFELTLTTYTLGLKFEHNPIGELFGTIGIDGMRQGNIRAGAISLIPNFRSYSGGIYWIENLQHGNWIFDAGVRYDYQWLHVYPIPSKNIVEGTHDYANLTGSVGAIYQLSSQWSIGMNLGSAWRPPSVNELYSNDVHHGSAQFEIGDINIHKERSFSADATLKHIGERSQGELSVYNTYFDGFIFLLPDPIPTVTIRGAYPTFRYKQAAAVLRGIDGIFTYQVVDQLRLGATVSIVRGVNLDIDEPLIQMPSDRLRLTAQFNLPEQGLWLRLPYVEVAWQLVRRQDHFPRNVDYTDPPPGYTLFDINAGTTVNVFTQPIKVSLSVQNVFNTPYRDYMSRYRYFSDDSGRNIVLRVALPFGATN